MIYIFWDSHMIFACIVYPHHHNLPPPPSISFYLWYIVWISRSVISLAKQASGIKIFVPSCVCVLCVVCVCFVYTFCWCRWDVLVLHSNFWIAKYVSWYLLRIPTYFMYMTCMTVVINFFSWFLSLQHTPTNIHTHTIQNPILSNILSQPSIKIRRMMTMKMIFCDIHSIKELWKLLFSIMLHILQSDGIYFPIHGWTWIVVLVEISTQFIEYIFKSATKSIRMICLINQSPLHTLFIVVLPMLLLQYI